MKDAFLSFHAPVSQQSQVQRHFPDRHGGFGFPHTGGNLQGTATPARIARSSSSAVINHRKSQQEMEEAMHAYLSEPSLHPTLFNVMDKLERLTQSKGALPATAEIIATQLRTDAATAARVEDILVKAWNHGLIRVYPQDAIELTAGGRWFVKEGRARRIALWTINPKLDLPEICAIVHIEDGEGPVGEVPSELLDVAPLRELQDADTALENQSVSREIGIDHKVCPVWRGLLVPMQSEVEAQA